MESASLVRSFSPNYVRGWGNLSQARRIVLAPGQETDNKPIPAILVCRPLHAPGAGGDRVAAATGLAGRGSQESREYKTPSASGLSWACAWRELSVPRMTAAK